MSESRSLTSYNTGEIGIWFSTCAQVGAKSLISWLIVSVMLYALNRWKGNNILFQSAVCATQRPVINVLLFRSDPGTLESIYLYTYLKVVVILCFAEMSIKSMCVCWQRHGRPWQTRYKMQDWVLAWNLSRLMVNSVLSFTSLVFLIVSSPCPTEGRKLSRPPTWLAAHRDGLPARKRISHPSINWARRRVLGNYVDRDQRVNN